MTELEIILVVEELKNPQAIIQELYELISRLIQSVIDAKASPTLY